MKSGVPKLWQSAPSSCLVDEGNAKCIQQVEHRNDWPENQIMHPKQSSAVIDCASAMARLPGTGYGRGAHQPKRRAKSRAERQISSSSRSRRALHTKLDVFELREFRLADSVIRPEYGRPDCVRTCCELTLNRALGYQILLRFACITDACHKSVLTIQGTLAIRIGFTNGLCSLIAG